MNSFVDGSGICEGLIGFWLSSSKLVAELVEMHVLPAAANVLTNAKNGL